MKSLLIQANVMHLRLRPVRHRFVYPVFMLRINLNEAYSVNKDGATSALKSWLFGINRWRPLAIYFKDYGPRDGSNLMEWGQQLLRSNQIEDVVEIELQSFPRVLGYAFNPICLWYCYDKQGALKAVLAEVNNTFGEHHFYLLSAENQSEILPGVHLAIKKMMHVSPFCEVKGHYTFNFKESTNKISVKIDYFDHACEQIRDDNNKKNIDTEIDTVLIHTAIIGSKQTLTTRNMFGAFLKQPFLTFGVFFRIHWQAYILWRKRVPFFKQPPALPIQLTIGTSIEQEQIK